MLESIYNGTVIVGLVLIGLFLVFLINTREEKNKIENIKGRIVFESLVVATDVCLIIFSIILKQPVIAEILLSIVWLLLIRDDFLTLKKCSQEAKTNQQSSCEEDIIDVDYKEIEAKADDEKDEL